MRVALVGPVPLNPDKFRGGVQTSMANLIAGLKTFPDMRLDVITFNQTLASPVHLERDGVAYHYWPSSAHFQTLTLHMEKRRTLTRALREVRPDVVHAEDALSFGYMCLKAAHGYPLVLSVHGIVHEERKHLSRVKDRIRATLTSWLIERYCVKNARYLIQPTRYPEQYFGRLITGKIYDTGNPIDDMFFSVNGEGETGSLLYSGLILRRKRLLDLLQALEIVKDKIPYVTLRIAGGAPEADYHRLVREWITGHHMDGNVVLLGPLSQAELVEEYRKCALLVLPSGQETSPMVIGEAMAAGKPVVATRVGGVPYLIDDPETGFIVDVGDVEALADRILRVLSDDLLRARLGQAAKEKANRQFRSREVAARVREVYRQAVSTHGR